MLWKPALDPTTPTLPMSGYHDLHQLTSGRGTPSAASAATMVDQLEESILVQQYKQQQLLNFQMGVAAMGASSTTNAYSRPGSYTAIQMTQPGTADGKTADIFWGLHVEGGR